MCSLHPVFSVKPTCKHDEHVQEACVFPLWHILYKHTHTHAHIVKRTMLYPMFVPEAGNWRVFIRLMDLKRKEKEDGGRTERRGWGDHWILPQQILYNSPTSHNAAGNFPASMIERAIFPLCEMALITVNLLHKSAPIEIKWAVAFLVVLRSSPAARPDGLDFIRITGLPAHALGRQSLINGLLLIWKVSKRANSGHRMVHGNWSIEKWVWGSYELIFCSREITVCHRCYKSHLYS